MKPAERLEARRLRSEQGASIKDIATRLGVSRSSVSTWVRDIELSGALVAAVAQRNPAINVAALTNADPDLLRVFRRFLALCYAVPDERLAFSVNCFLGNGLSIEEIEAYWLEVLDLPRTCLRASIVDRASSASRRRGRTLVHGTGRLSVASTAVVQSIYGAIQEYASLHRPEWLG